MKPCCCSFVFSYCYFVFSVWQKYEIPKYFTCIEFSPNGDVITGDSNGSITVWGKGTRQSYFAITVLTSQARSIIPLKILTLTIYDLLVVGFRFISAFLLAQWPVNSHASWLWYFCHLSFLEFDVNPKAILSIFSKIFESDQVQRSHCKKFTAHYTCRNADLYCTCILVAVT